MTRWYPLTYTYKNNHKNSSGTLQVSYSVRNHIRQVCLRWPKNLTRFEESEGLKPKKKKKASDWKYVSWGGRGHFERTHTCTPLLTWQWLIISIALKILLSGLLEPKRLHRPESLCYCQTPPVLVLNVPILRNCGFFFFMGKCQWFLKDCFLLTLFIFQLFLLHVGH